MDNRTREALEGSIEKWKAIERQEGHDYGTTNCPLCKLFRHDSCIGCPVADADHAFCIGTPYAGWTQALEDIGRDLNPDGEGPVDITHIDEAPLDEVPRLKRLARDEREFLESLRPLFPEDGL